MWVFYINTNRPSFWHASQYSSYRERRKYRCSASSQPMTLTATAVNGQRISERKLLTKIAEAGRWAAFLHDTATRSIKPIQLQRCLITSTPRQTAWEQRQLRRQPSAVYCPCLMREKTGGERERENEFQAFRLYSPPRSKKRCLGTRQ